MEIRGPLDRSPRKRPPQAARRRRSPRGSRRPGAGEGAAAIGAECDLAGVEAARERGTPWRSAWLACAAGALLAALLLVQLRTESIDLRYRLARSLQSEQRLLEEQRRLIVELRRLRHPVRLAEIGTALGLARPHDVRELPGGGLQP